jgi:hypothetical protein
MWKLLKSSEMVSKKYVVCNRSRMIVKILEVWIASKIRLRPGRDVGIMNALFFSYFLLVTQIDFIIVTCAKSNRAELPAATHLISDCKMMSR